MFVDARSTAEGTVVHADICIIGAGAAGITLARELNGSSVQVTVLESGGFESEGDTQALYQGPSVGLPYEPLIAPRLRYFGGSTNHWGGICRPLEEADFEAREGIAFTGWPLHKSDLAAFYGPAARICQLSSEDWDVEDWTRRDDFSPLPLGSDRIIDRVAQVVPPDARSFGKNFRDELNRARNVIVQLHANVTGVETDEAGRTTTSVRVATLAGNRFSVRARLFVLATGAIENARLLLASNDRWPRGLGNQHDLVGRFFQEHPRFIGAILVPFDPHLRLGFYDVHPVADAGLFGYLASSKELQLAEGLLDVQMRLQPVLEGQFEEVATASSVTSLNSAVRAIRRREAVPDLGRHVRNVITDLMSWQKAVIPGAPLPVPYPEVLSRLATSSRSEAEQAIPVLLGDLAARGYAEVAGAPIDSILVSTRIEQAPNPDSRVMLIGERDQLGMRRVALDWRLSDVDKHNARRTLEILGAEVGRVGIGRLQILLDEQDDGWPEDLAGGAHLMGTTRMSDNPRQGVVDRDGRVHGMSNLFIAGSSLYPTGGGATPTLTLVALALRLAKHLKRRLQG